MLSHHLHDATIDACFRSFEMLNTYEKVFSATFLAANAYVPSFLLPLEGVGSGW